jgi:hypothetical protein
MIGVRFPASGVRAGHAEPSIPGFPMPFLPHDRFAFDSPLSPDEASSRLADLVEPRPRYRLVYGPLSRPFEGEVTPRIFRIRRVVLGRRGAFALDIQGAIRRGARGSRIEGTMALHPLSRAFFHAWMGFTVLLFFVSLTMAFGDGFGFGVVLIPCAQFLLGWALMSHMITEEIHSARRSLADGLAAKSADARHMAERPR